MKVQIFLALVASLLGLAVAEQSWVYGGQRYTGTLNLTMNHPKICDDVQQWAGYYQISQKFEKNYFFWAFAARKPTNKTLLWMTGGPGCSSQVALFGENGPCKINKEGTDTYKNQFGWNEEANLIYIDQPANVGFSYSTRGGEDHDQAGVAEDMYYFLQDLFADHPEWTSGAGSEFYIFGESYGGHYAPSTAHRVWKGNQDKEGIHIPLTGVAVGNGLTAPEIQYQYYPEMAYTYSKEKVGRPSVSEEVFEGMKQAVDKCNHMINLCQSEDRHCTLARDYCNSQFVNPYVETGRNVYDIREECKFPPLCYDFSEVQKFLDSREIQKALGVNKKWESCNFEVNAAFAKDWMKGFENKIPDLLASGIRVLIYAGDVDYICNWIGNKAWTKSLEWSGSEQFNANEDKAWKPTGEHAGDLRQAGPFSFLRVFDAGHMVPLDQPEVSLEMVKQFLSNTLKA